MKPANDSLGFLLADVSRLMRRALTARLDPAELTLAQARALAWVHRHEGVRQIDLAQLLEVQPITLARLIDQLAHAGLVERRPDPDDRRAYRIFLTPAAGRPLAQIADAGRAVRAEALAGLSAAEADALTAALIRIRANLSTLSPPETP